MSWRRLPCTRQELRLSLTLACGQSFRWQETSPGEWTGVLAKKVWTLSQNDTHLLYRTVPQVSTPEQTDVVKLNPNKIKIEPDTVNIISDEMTVQSPVEVKEESKQVAGRDISATSDASILTDYFQLSVNLSKLYQQWSKVDPNFKSRAEHFEGVRMLRQDPVENLFAFICSSNNNISRISSMVHKLCEEYGDAVASVSGQTHFSFPSVQALAGANVEQRLRELGFGYRAKFISKSARFIQETKLGEDWLWSLRGKTYAEAKAELMQLCGVGGKVADCVCLMSLDKSEAVPIDTHVWQIAARDYMPKLRETKSLTDKLYQEIGEHFRDLWGDFAGWAHSVLFSADLKKFQEKSPKKSPKATKRKSTDVSPRINKRKV